MTVRGLSDGFIVAANITLTTTVPPSYTVNITPSIQIAPPNGTVYFTTTVKALNDFSRTVTLDVHELPHGVSATWSENPVVPDAYSVLTLSTPAAPICGEYLLQVVGKSGTNIASGNFHLLIPYPFKVFLPVILKSGTSRQ
jgi:hypothetical protein